MTPPMGQRRRHGRDGEHGQMIVIFTLCLIAIISMAALLVDGGLAWSNRREAQAAADTAALAAAKDVVANDTVKGEAAAKTVALANKFGPGKDCDGVDLADDGVTVNRPPTKPGTPHVGDNDFVEVITTRAMRTTFAAAVGQSCWMVSSRAVASIGSSSAASCSFCSLNNTKDGHTILLQNGASLRVDGDIYTNSYNGCVGTSTVNGLVQCNDGSTCALKSWKVCGDGFDVFGTPPSPPAYISARTISVVGGWETHDENIVIADSRNAPPARTACPYSPNPPLQGIASDVCIHMPPIVDPFKGVTAPIATDYAVPTATSCLAASGTSGVKAGSASAVTSITSGSWTICPGKYYGLSITGAATRVVMLSGVYFVTNKGFIVTSGGSVDGSAGVMIYNAQSGSNGAVNIAQLAEGIDILPNPDLVSERGFDLWPGSPFPKLAFTPAGKSRPSGGGRVTYTLTVSQATGNKNKLAGTLHFYDGDTQLDSPGDPNCPTKIQAALTNTFAGTCKIQWVAADVGTHGLSGVFVSSNVTYDSVEAIQSPREVITASGVTGGTTKLGAMSGGPYAGFVIWQAAASNVAMIISPQSSLPNCTGSWMTDGIPTTAPPPCGDMGGISGTIYAGGPTAQVQLTAQGLADLQVIAGKILVTNGVDARFAYTPAKFALGGIRLVE